MAQILVSEEYSLGNLAKTLIPFSTQWVFGHSLSMFSNLSELKVRKGILHSHVYSAYSCTWKSIVSNGNFIHRKHILYSWNLKIKFFVNLFLFFS